MTDPRHTRAVVVGVENCPDAPGWQLDGPVADALGYVTRLLRSGVPEDRITLLLSPLDSNVALAGRAPVPYLPADRETVHRVLFRELPSAGAAFTVVTWSGHGLVDPDGRHRLLYADATADEIRALDVEAALTAHRATAGRQLWLLDACRGFADPATLPGALRPDPVPPRPPLPHPAQHTVFTCTPGPPAHGTPRGGVLARVALPLLTSAPGPEQLVADVRRHLDALLTDPAATGAPDHVWYGEDDEGAAPAPAPPPPTTPTARPGLELRRRLLQALEQVPVLADPASRQAVLDQFPPTIRGSLPRHPSTRLDLLGVITTCLEFPEGLGHLWAAVRLVDGGTTAAQRVRSVLGEFPGFPPEPGDDLE